MRLRKRIICISVMLLAGALMGAVLLTGCSAHADRSSANSNDITESESDVRSGSPELSAYDQFLEWTEQNNLELDQQQEKQAFADWLEENPQPVSTIDPEVRADLQAMYDRFQEIENFLDAIDQEAADILYSYTGKRLDVLTLDWSANMSHMQDMLDLLDDHSINYEEFDTIFRYFLRRIDLVRERNPEFEESINQIIGPCIEYYNYEYIPNGTE